VGGGIVEGMDQEQRIERDESEGTGGDVAGSSGDVVLGAWASIRSALEVISQARLWSRSDAQARDGVREGFATLQSAQACWLALIADLDARPEAVPLARAGLVAKTFLRSRLLRTAAQAGADMRAVQALAAEADPAVGGLPLMRDAFAAGLISREHVDVAITAVRRLPKRVLSEPVPLDFELALGLHSNPGTETGAGAGAETGAEAGVEAGAQTEAEAGAETGTEMGADAGAETDAEACAEEVVSAGEAVDAFLTVQAQQLDPQKLAFLARHLLTALDPDGQDGFDPEATERRGLTHSTDAGGMVVGKFQLDPVTGASFSTAMDHFSAPNPTRTEQTDDGGSVTIRDMRTAAQRRADALGVIARLALGADEAGTAKGGEAPRIVIYTGLEELDTTLGTPAQAQPTAKAAARPWVDDVAVDVSEDAAENGESLGTDDDLVESGSEGVRRPEAEDLAESGIDDVCSPGADDL
jgi:hypothetical protein